MPDKIIAIVGITGNQGASIANVFLNKPGWKVRGITRDPNKASAQALGQRGADMIAGDLDDPESIRKALKGAHVIFGNTDFGQFLFDPATNAQAQAQGRGVNELATEHEERQAINLMDAVAATEDSLELYIYSAFSDCKGWTKGKITYNLHFDCKWAAIAHLKKAHPSVWEKTSLLQLVWFMTNWKTFPRACPQKQSDGTFRYALPFAPDFRMPMFEPNKDTGNFVEAMVDHLPPKTNLMGVSDAITGEQYAQIWGDVNGVQCVYEQTDLDDIERSLEPMGLGLFGREMGQAFKYIIEYGNHGGDPTATWPWDLKIDIKKTTVEEYIRSQDWSSVLNS